MMVCFSYLATFIPTFYTYSAFADVILFVPLQPKIKRVITTNKLRIIMNKKIQFLAAVMLTATVVSCGKQEQQRTLAPVKVEIETVGTSDKTSKRNYVGVVEEEKSSSLSFATMGTIRSIVVKEGQHVSKGQLIATLDNTSAQNALDAAAAMLHQAEDGYKRMKMLYDKKSLPEVKMVEIESKLQEAKSMYEISKKNLDDCTLYAPFSGVVGECSAEAGENVSPGVPVITLLQTSNVKIRISVPENEISRLTTAASSVITVSALGNKKFDGGAIEKSSAADAIAHSYDARINLSNSTGELLPGMVCSVDIMFDRDATHAIAIPVRAVQESSNGEKFVWKVVGDSVTKCNVAIGELVGNDIVIKSGLSSGDRIVREGYQKIGQGTKITE